ncbi:MAG: hypothetical protein KF732_00890 [Flavobacteriales bacterium]|nr:hypothetical protein [Flavobacteriales bacterium]MBX2958490.1 hypothetical protein [Flavobacteriales bacterium]MCL4857429.1 hypothetical protein [Flavobacteriales bacterium]HRN40957.1 hypothetical protein [Vicingus sp.]HRP60786.1 hypothetical protein [Vicingus sp.]
MNTSALIMMITTEVIVTLVTGYFFLRVLKTPPKPEPDSYIDNDDDER